MVVVVFASRMSDLFGFHTPLKIWESFSNNRVAVGYIGKRKKSQDNTMVACQHAERTCQKLLVNHHLIRIAPCRNAVSAAIVRGTVERVGCGTLLHGVVEQRHTQRYGCQTLRTEILSAWNVDGSHQSIGSVLRSRCRTLPRRPAVGVVVVHRAHPAVCKWLMQASDPHRRLPRPLRVLVAEYWPFVPEGEMVYEEDMYDPDGVELCRDLRNRGKCRFADSCVYSHFKS